MYHGWVRIFFFLQKREINVNGRRDVMKGGIVGGSKKGNFSVT